MLNMRKLGSQELNIFEEFLNNKFFLIIFFGLIGSQLTVFHFGGDITSTQPLTIVQYIVCICVGASVLGVGAILKLTPPEWVSKIPIKMNEDTFSREDPIKKALKKV